jgi:hypothetical protein
MQRYERVIEFPTAKGNVKLQVQQGGAGRFYLMITLPERPASNEVSISVPVEYTDQLAHAIGKAADASGE